MKGQWQYFSPMSRAHLLEVQAGHTEAMAAQRAELESSMQRHLDLIDRLLADKDALGCRIEELQAQTQAQHSQHSKALSALKEGWAQELLQQRGAWAAAEKARTPFETRSTLTVE